MKVRNGFVSNSSSSSFVIALDAITAKQLMQIYNHLAEGKKLGLYCANYCDEGDRWRLTEKDGKLFGGTTMDNFSMSDFLEEIGVSKKDIKWEEFWWPDDDSDEL